MRVMALRVMNPGGLRSGTDAEHGAFPRGKVKAQDSANHAFAARLGSLPDESGAPATCSLIVAGTIVAPTR